MLNQPDHLLEKFVTRSVADDAPLGVAPATGRQDAAGEIRILGVCQDEIARPVVAIADPLDLPLVARHNHFTLP